MLHNIINILLKFEYNKFCTKYWEAQWRSIDYKNACEFFPKINRYFHSKEPLHIDLLEVLHCTEHLEFVRVSGGSACVRRKLKNCENSHNSAAFLGYISPARPCARSRSPVSPPKPADSQHPEVWKLKPSALLLVRDRNRVLVVSEPGVRGSIHVGNFASSQASGGAGTSAEPSNWHRGWPGQVEPTSVTSAYTFR